MHPEQIISSLPQAVAAMLDPADCGPAFIALPQDIQEVAFDYPEAFFAPTVHEIPRPRPDRKRVAAGHRTAQVRQAPADHRGRRRRAIPAPRRWWRRSRSTHGIPLTETIAGKSTVTHDHPAYAGPIGIVGSTSANALAAEADVIVAIGTRLDGLHHRLVDGLRPGREVHLHQRGALGRHQAPRTGRGRRCAGNGGGTRRRPQGLEGRCRLDRQGARPLRPVEQGARRLPEAHQRAGADLCPGGGRGEQEGRQARLHDHRGGRPSGRDHEELAGQVAATPSISNSASPAWATRSPAAGARPWPIRRARPSSWWATAPT